MKVVTHAAVVLMWYLRSKLRRALQRGAYHRYAPFFRVCHVLASGVWIWQLCHLRRVVPAVDEHCGGSSLC